MKDSEQFDYIDPLDDDPVFDNWVSTEDRTLEGLEKQGFDKRLFTPTDDWGEEIEGIEAIRCVGERGTPHISIAVIGSGERRAEFLGLDNLSHPIPARAAAEEEAWKLLEALYDERFGA